MKTLLYLLLFFLISCNVTNNQKSTKTKTINDTFSIKTNTTKNNIPVLQTIWVDAKKVDCYGMVMMKCLRICKKEEQPLENWTSLYSSIIGFEYEEGYLYKLNVKIEKIQNPPADASNLKYTLIKVEEKIKVNN